MFGASSFAATAFVDSDSGRLVLVTGVQAEASVSDDTRETAGSLSENPIGTTPLASGETSPFVITVVTNASASVTGVSATAAVGDVTASGDSSTSVTGVSATASVGDVSVIGDGDIAVTGVAGTGSPGSVTVTGGTGVSVALSSPRLQGQVGVVAPNAEIKVFLTGVAGTGGTGGASVVSWDEIIVNQDPNWVEIAA